MLNQLRALYMRTASGDGSGSAVRREERIPSMSESRETKALPKITLSGTAALQV